MRGVDSLTVKSRPWNFVPCKALMTAAADSSGTSTKPKPRLLWVLWSRPMRALITLLNGLTSLVRSAAVIVKGRLPKYNILLMFLEFPYWQCTHFGSDVQVTLQGYCSSYALHIRSISRILASWAFFISQMDNEESFILYGMMS